jgi:chemotaxis protein methyltransferase CheR
MRAEDRRKQSSLSDAEFRMFSDLVRRHCGLDFSPDSRFLLETRIAKRMRDLKVSSFAAYHYLVRSAPAYEEFSRLVEELVTNETYFFRERAQLGALIFEILPEIRRQQAEDGGGPVRVWSAGCAGGEEPYSIVMLALEAGLQPGVDLRVYASDISQRMMRRARQGVFPQASFRDTDDSLRRRYFSEKNGAWRIDDSIRKHVDLIHLNLLDRSKLAVLGAMDVIVCRNVMIYFDAMSKRRVIESFFEKLRPGGHLLLGHSESLINLSTSFELHHLRSDLCYRKPQPGMFPQDSWQADAERAIEKVDGRSGKR